MENTFDILDRFVNGQTLTDGEFAALKRLFATREGGRTIEMWLAAKWETASDADAEIGYDALRRKIDDYEHARSLRRRIAGSALLRSYQRIAAVLLVPLLVVASLIAFGPLGEAKTYTAEAPWGEKARLVLAELLTSRPNFLILDEPTNHMDIPAKEVLEAAFEAVK